MESAGVAPQNGINLIEAVAQDDGISTATLITTLVAFDRWLQGVTYSPPVGAAIAAFVQAGTLNAATAVADVATAALSIASDTSDFGSNLQAFAVGQQFAVMVGQLASSLGSDPVVAAINTINGPTTAQTLTGQIDLVFGLSSTNTASVVTGLKDNRPPPSPR